MRPVSCAHPGRGLLATVCAYSVDHIPKLFLNRGIGFRFTLCVQPLYLTGNGLALTSQQVIADKCIEAQCQLVDIAEPIGYSPGRVFQSIPDQPPVLLANLSSRFVPGTPVQLLPFHAALCHGSQMDQTVAETI